MDDADRAQQVTDQNLERSLNKVMSQPHESSLEDTAGNRICVDCEKPIPLKRLEVLPHAVRDIGCQEVFEREG